MFRNNGWIGGRAEPYWLASEHGPLGRIRRGLMEFSDGKPFVLAADLAAARTRRPRHVARRSRRLGTHRR